MMATEAILCTKSSIWISSVETCRMEPLACLMPWLISPMKVSSPVKVTTQLAEPFSTEVPKKAKLWASVGGEPSFSATLFRGAGTLSPVSAELSTSMPSEQ